MASGEVLEVIATDVMSMIDMPHFCTEQGHEHLLAEKRDQNYVFQIRRR